MIDTNYFPDNFNIAQMYALVKDPRKDSADPNNIRPISVSDVITNIFERLMLYEITKKHPGISRQFGFKANSSCSHAIFVLNESLKFIKKKKK